MNLPHFGDSQPLPLRPEREHCCYSLLACSCSRTVSPAANKHPVRCKTCKVLDRREAQLDGADLVTMHRPPTVYLGHTVKLGTVTMNLYAYCRIWLLWLLAYPVLAPVRMHRLCFAGCPREGPSANRSSWTGVRQATSSFVTIEGVATPHPLIYVKH